MTTETKLPEYVGTMANWLRDGPTLLKEFQLEHVTIVDREPLRLRDDRWVWMRPWAYPAPHDGEPCTIPAAIWSGIAEPDRQSSKEEALAALSEACLAWARGSQ